MLNFLCSRSVHFSEIGVSHAKGTDLSFLSVLAHTLAMMTLPYIFTSSLEGVKHC